MIDEDLFNWWYSIPLRTRDSFKRLINNSILQTVTEADIRFAKQIYEEELKLAAETCWLKRGRSANLDFELFEEGFVEGFRYVFNTHL